jgi:ribosome-binding protein aMBF1 (putative translation factor)
MTAPLPAEKTCRRCGQTKPAGAFHRDARMRDGLQSWCARCVNERSREIRRARGQGPAVRRVSVHPGWFRCAMCGKDLPGSEFRKDGRGRPMSYCRPCHNAYLTQLNRVRRKDPAVKEALRKADRRRRAARKIEHASERADRLHGAQTLIERMRARGWTLRRLAAEAGIARSTLQGIRAGHVPFPATFARLVAFARERAS